MKTVGRMAIVGLLGAAAPATAATLQEYAVHYAPVLYQDTADGFPNDWRNRRYDLVTRFDFDGNDDAADNWARAESWKIPAFVYWDGQETETHVFLVYGFFHPRDWDVGCFYPLCHENDQENYRLTIRKDGTELGTPILLDGDSHGQHHAFGIDGTVTSGRTDVSTTVPSFDGSHVRLFLESKGHGPQQCADEADCLGKIGDGGDGVVFRVTAGGGAPPIAEPDVEAGGLLEAEYGLLPSFESLWVKIPNDHEEAFDATGAVAYDGRFPLPFLVPKEYNSDDWGSEGDGHMTWGVEFVSGGADRLLDWGLDPALSVKEHFTLPGEDDVAQYSLTYTCNPYFGIFDSCPERQVSLPEPEDPVAPERIPEPQWRAEAVDAATGYPGCTVGCVSCAGGAGIGGGLFALAGLGAVAIGRRRRS